MHLLDYLRRIQPTYGSEKHQQAFLARMERAQELHPCSKDHAGDTPPTHTHRCYPVDRQGRMICA